MNKLRTFTSTGAKLMHHPHLISLLKIRLAQPVSLQVAPTSRCNLKCSFCSNALREKHEDLDFEILREFIERCAEIGLRTVEITGGGDPTMYYAINDLIELCFATGLEIGMITNGVALNKVHQGNLDRLKWLRVSMNSLEYVPEVEIPDIEGTLGFSFCVHEKVTFRHDVYRKLEAHVDKYKPEYVRVVPDCLPSADEQYLRAVCRRIVSEYGDPFFFQDKDFQRPKNCWWCYLKPFLLHDRYVYPCSSVVLNEGAEGIFHHRYRWVHMKEFFELYSNEMVPFSTKSCNRCVFKSQNDMINELIYPTGMENFL